MVACPICSQAVKQIHINAHLDSGCQILLNTTGVSTSSTPRHDNSSPPVAGFFKPRAANASSSTDERTANKAKDSSQPKPAFNSLSDQEPSSVSNTAAQTVNAGPSSSNSAVDPIRLSSDNVSVLEPKEDQPSAHDSLHTKTQNGQQPHIHTSPQITSKDHEPPPSPPRPSKRVKTNGHASSIPLAERMRPLTLDAVQGQPVVAPGGVLRELVEWDRVPSLILWGGPGTGKTSIARALARTVNARCVELHAAEAGVAECRKLFGEARHEQRLTGRRTLLFCDEIHRFSRAQQEVFLAPVEAGIITLVGATTENPAFRLQPALLSRCRVFALEPLDSAALVTILHRALLEEMNDDAPAILAKPSMLEDIALLAQGDARTALSLLSLAMSTVAASQGSSSSPPLDAESLRASLAQSLTTAPPPSTDEPHDALSALHKSIRGSDPDASLYYLARCLRAGTDPLHLARRLVVAASEDIGLADNSMLALATAAHSAVERVGLPEARIPLAHVTAALALAPKSTRAYRGLHLAEKALDEPYSQPIHSGYSNQSNPHETPGSTTHVNGSLSDPLHTRKTNISTLPPVPMHLRNAPTGWQKRNGWGQGYKYNPDFREGRVQQAYLPAVLQGRKFLPDDDLGAEEDADLLATRTQQ